MEVCGHGQHDRPEFKVEKQMIMKKTGVLRQKGGVMRIRKGG